MTTTEADVAELDKDAKDLRLLLGIVVAIALLLIISINTMAFF